MRHIFLCLLTFVFFVAPAVASAQHWTLVKENKQCAIYVDTDSIRADADGDGWFDSAGMWFKTVYTSPDELYRIWDKAAFPSSYDDAALLKGEVRSHTTMNFWTGTVHIDHPSFLDQDGNMLAAGMAFDTTVDREVFYARLFAFAETYLTGDEALAAFDGNDSFVILDWQEHLKDVTYYNAWRMYRDRDGAVIVPVYLCNDTKPMKGVLYESFDFTGQQHRIVAFDGWIAQDKVWHFEKRDEPWKSPYSGSMGERAFDELQTFCQHHAAYVARFHDGKLRLKKSLR